MTTPTHRCCGTTKRETPCKRTISAKRFADGITWCGTCQPPSNEQPDASNLSASRDVIAASNVHAASDEVPAEVSGSSTDFVFTDEEREAFTFTAPQIAALVEEHQAATRSLVASLEAADNAFSRIADAECRRWGSSYLRPPDLLLYKGSGVKVLQTGYAQGNPQSRAVVGFPSPNRLHSALLSYEETSLFYDGLSVTTNSDLAALNDVDAADRHLRGIPEYQSEWWVGRCVSLSRGRVAFSDFTAGTQQGFAACEQAQRYFKLPETGTADALGLRVVDDDTYESTGSRFQLIQRGRVNGSPTDSTDAAYERQLAIGKLRKFPDDTSCLLLHPTMLAPTVDPATGHVNVDAQPESGVASAVSVSGLAAWLVEARDAYPVDDVHAYVKLSVDPKHADATITLVPIISETCHVRGLPMPDESTPLRMPVSVASSGAMSDPDLFVSAHVISDAVVDAAARGSKVVTFAWDSSTTSAAATAARRAEEPNEETLKSKKHNVSDDRLFQGALYIDCDTSSQRSARGVTVMCDGVPRLSEEPRRLPRHYEIEDTTELQIADTLEAIDEHKSIIAPTGSLTGGHPQ